MNPRSEKIFEDAGSRIVLEVRTPQLIVTHPTGSARRAVIDFYFRELMPFAAAATRKIDVVHDWSDERFVRGGGPPDLPEMG